MGRGRYVSAAPGRRRARGAAVLAPLLLLAACTGTGGPPPAGSAQALPPTTSVPPPIDAEGRTSPSVVWSAGPRARQRPRGATAAVLVEVRTGRHDGFDRVTFQFRDGLPGYQVRYVDAVTGAHGTPVSLRGEAFLLLAFDGARAGSALADLRPGYASIKHVRLLDDGGGRVRFGIGLGAVAGYKVSELPPDRMYIDVAA